MDLSKYSTEELEAMLDSGNAYDPTEGMSTYDKIMAGVGRGMHNVYQQVGNMAVMIPDSDLEEYRKLDAPLLDTTAGSVGNLIGEIAATAPVGGGIASGIGRGVSAVAPRLVAGSGVVGQGVGRGAIEGAVESAMVGGDPMSGSFIGGGIGGAIPGVGRAWRGMGRPARPSRAALEIERLGRNQGVDIGLTAGQLADDGNLTGSLIKGVENTIDRVPGAGAILHAKEEAMSNWNRAEIRNALPADMAEGITTSGPKGMEQARNEINRGYSDVLDGIRTGDVTLTDNAIDELAGLEQYAINRIDQDQLPGVQKDINNLLSDLAENRLDGKNIKELEASYGRKLQSAKNKGNIDSANAYRGMRDLLRRQRDATVGADGANRLHEIDAAYSKIAPIRKAASMKGSVHQGYFTPSQLLTGGQAGQSEWGKAIARSPVSKRAIAADDVFGSTIPNVGPGTAEKLAAQSMLGGAASVIADLSSGGSGGLVQSGLIGAMAAPAVGQIMPYMRNPLMGRTAGQAAMRRMQSPLEQLLDSVRPYAVAPGVLGYQED